MRWFYAAYNTAICIAPVSGVYIWLRRFQLPWRRLIYACMATSTLWLILGMIGAARGWRSYNPAYILGPTLFGLPLEEIAFLVAVPLICGVLLCLLGMRIHGRVHARTAKRLLLACAGVLMFCITAQLRKERMVVGALLALLAIACLYRSRFITYRLFWYWNAGILGCCLVLNAVLTVLPVVIENNAFVTGLRIGTIPIEDFVYYFSLFNMFALVFLGSQAWYAQTFFRARTKPTASPKSIHPPQNQSA